MKYNNKSEFLNGLREALGRYNVPDAREILIDFEQHFDDGAAAGESEAQVCEKLGDVEEIAKQYISDIDFSETESKTASAAEEPAASGFGAETGETAQQYSYGQQYAAGQNMQNPQAAQTAPNMQNAQTAPNAQNAQQYAAPQNGFSPDGGKVVGVICVDLFVFFWAIPSLLTVILSFYSAVVAFGVSGISIIVLGAVSSFADVTGILHTGLAPISCVLLGILLCALCGMLVLLCVQIGKGFCAIIRNIINWHSRVFVGRNVINKKNKNVNREAAVQ
ncbi:MAG: HAAS signaling domain-containing protein [Ruminiclostridium sp.]